MSTNVTAELNELRSQVRTLKRMLFGVFGLVVVGGLLAATSLQSVPDVIRAKKFEVVDDKDRSKVVLASGRFVMRNEEGKRLVEMYEQGSGAKLTLYPSTYKTPALGRENLPLVSLGIDGGGGYLETRDHNGYDLVTLSSVPVKVRGQNQKTIYATSGLIRCWGAVNGAASNTFSAVEINSSMGQGKIAIRDRDEMSVRTKYIYPDN